MRQAGSEVQPRNTLLIGAGVVALVGIVISVFVLALETDRFLQVYLAVYLFWLELSLGCLGLLMVPNGIKARWSLAIQRIAAAGARTLPLLALLFIPILLGMESLFPWVGADIENAAGSGFYLTVPFFIVRAVIYFVIWIGLAYVLTSWSYQSDTSDDRSLFQRSYVVSIIGGVLYFLTASFAAFDWSMSIVDGWFSSVYGWLAISRMGLSALALSLIVLSLLWKSEPLASWLNRKARGDLAVMLLVSLMIWMYLAFMQYVIIWSANISSKAIWYSERLESNWEGFAFFLVLIHVLALILLLIPGAKRITEIVLGTAGVLLVMRFFDMYWTVLPTYNANISVQWWEPILLITMGVLWVALFWWTLSSHPVFPANDPGVAEVEHHGTHEKEESYESAG